MIKAATTPMMPTIDNTLPRMRMRQYLFSLRRGGTAGVSPPLYFISVTMHVLIAKLAVYSGNVIVFLLMYGEALMNCPNHRQLKDLQKRLLLGEQQF